MLKKPFYDNGEELKIADIFYSVQGEGPRSGEPSVFVRLQGCNLRCPWCDEPDALDNVADGETGRLTPVQLVQKTAAMLVRCGQLVFTGGEPLLQSQGIGAYLRALYDSKINVVASVETNGTQYNAGIQRLRDMYNVEFVVSPKDKPTVRGATTPHKQLMQLARAVKVVVEEGTDIEADYLKYRALITDERSQTPWLYLQPEDGAREKVLPRCLDFVMEHAREARLSMRIHKELGVK